MVFFAATKEELLYILETVKNYIHSLKVKLKQNYSIFPVENGVDFVGYVFRHDYVLLRNSIKKEIVKLLFRYINHKISKRKTRKSLASYFGWLKYCNSKHFLYKIETTSGLIYKAWIGEKTTFSKCKHYVNCITLDIRSRYTLIFCIYNKHSKILQTCSKNLKENIKKRLLKCKKQELQMNR